MEPFQDRPMNLISPELPSVQVQSPTLATDNSFSQYSQDPPPPASGYEPATNDYEVRPNDLGIEGIVNTHSRRPSIPIEKQEQLTRELSLRHPAERADYHIVDPRVPPTAIQYTPQMVEDINRLSRESRRMEIEMDDRGRDKRRRADVEIDGVEFAPRIARVESEEWGKR